MSGSMPVNKTLSNLNMYGQKQPQSPVHINEQLQEMMGKLK